MGDFGPILGPVEKAMRLHSYIKGMQFEEESRQNQRELMKLHLEQTKRDRATQDFDTALHLNQIGGILTKPGMAGKFESALAGKGTVTTPAGQQYSLPSPEQQAERQGRITGLQRSAEMETEQQAERKAGWLVDFPLKQFLPNIQGVPETLPVNPKEIANLVGHLRSINQERWAHSEIKTDPQTGKTYFLGVKENGEEVEKEFTTHMTPKPATQKPGSGEISPHAYEALTKVQGIIDKWRGGPKADLVQDTLHPERRGKQSEAELEAAKAAVANALRAYPNELEGGIKKVKEKVEVSRGVFKEVEREYPWITAKGQASAARVGQAAQPDSVPASKLAQLLNDPDVKKRGIKDINALKKDLIAHGIKIAEDQ